MNKIFNEISEKFYQKDQLTHNTTMPTTITINNTCKITTKDNITTILPATHYNYYVLTVM